MYGPQGNWLTPSGPNWSYASMTGVNPMMDPNAMYADYTQKYGEAKSANESRYAQGMQGYDERYSRGMANLQGAGQQELADIRQRGDQAKSANLQKLNSLGLSGTTVGATMNAGADRETNADLGRAQERIRQQRLTTDAGLSGDKLGFLERRNDPYPDMGSYASLMMQMGKLSGAGAGGGAAGAGGMGGAGGAGAMPGAYGGAGGGMSDAYAAGAGMGSPMSGMYVANTNGAYGGATGGGQQVFGSADEIARAGRLRQAGSITGDNLDAQSVAQQSRAGSRWGAPALQFNPANYGAGIQMMPKMYRG